MTQKAFNYEITTALTVEAEEKRDAATRDNNQAILDATELFKNAAKQADQANKDGD